MMRGTYLAVGMLIGSAMLSACRAQPSTGALSEADLEATIEARVVVRLTEIAQASTPTPLPATATPLPATEVPPASPTPVRTEEDEEATAEPSPTPTVAPVTTPVEPYTEAGMDLLVTLNDWRISENMLPYEVNQTLTDLAQAQADYIDSLGYYPADFHQGPNGEYPKERAADAGWPYYHTPEQILIDEIANIGANADEALHWWLGSDIHSRSLHNAAYREIGVGTVEQQYGYLYVVVVGSRPDFLPTLYDPGKGQISLSYERYEYAVGGEFMLQPTMYQIVAALDAPVSPDAWSLWEPHISAPTDLGSTYVVVYTDGEHEVRSVVDQAVNILWLRSNLTPSQ